MPHFNTPCQCTMAHAQVTQIGRQVNQLRKWKGGRVSGRAKALVKQWKQLLPEEGESEGVSCSSVESSVVGSDSNDAQLTCVAGRLGGPGMAPRRLEHHHSSRGVSMEVPMIHVESGEDSEASVVEITKPVGHAKKSRHRDKDRKKRSEYEHEEKASVSRTFEMSLDPSSNGGGGGGGGGGGLGGRRGQAHRTAARDANLAETRRRIRSKSPAVLPVGGARERSPAVGDMRGQSPAVGSIRGRSPAVGGVGERSPAVLLSRAKSPPGVAPGPTLGVKRKGVCVYYV